jgi:hypothetical protein
MSTRHLVWVGFLVVALGGGAWGDEVDELMRQFQNDVQQITTQAQKTVEVRRQQTVQQLDQMAQALAAAGNEAGAAKAREMARRLGGGAAGAPAAPGVAAPGAGAKCEVLWAGTWYKAVVLQQKDGKFQIKYDGYGDEWNEWVGPDRIRFAGGAAAPAGAGAAVAGKKCQVFWGSSWYDATVLEQKDGKFYIKYDGYGDTWNEWVGEDRIRFVGGNPVPNDRPARLGPNKSVQVEWGGQWWPAMVLQTKDGKAFIHYDNHDDSWNEWVGPERIRAK